MATNNRASMQAYQAFRAYMNQREYLPPAPPIDEKVVPAYWAHQCAVTGQEEWDFWHGGPHTCEHGCGYNTNPTTILRNRDGQQLETVQGENLLEDRFVEWWAICCCCRRWQENVLPAHSLYGRIYKVIGENCCDHCRNVTEGSESCTYCLAITKYREVTHTMNGVNIPGAARDRHHKIVRAARRHIHPNFEMEFTTSPTIPDIENEGQNEEGLEGEETCKEDRNDEEHGNDREKDKENEGDHEKVSQDN
ncbi:hypothetical protein QBC41DRAFT_228700 [Cercophora samala]|uniref:Uncharacterized protein n=1 Tax=Cercophora samala TaxID=330535 RepID=A0AA39ZBD5_9PEZI|nr:hypothetical protein QBC41DRAFT_228700 [Cercophora samala]